MCRIIGSDWEMTSTRLAPVMILLGRTIYEELDVVS